MAAFSSSASRLNQTAPPFFPQAVLPAPAVAPHRCFQPPQLHMPEAYGWCPVARGCCSYWCRSAGFLSVSGVWSCAFPPPPPPPLLCHPGYCNFPALPPLLCLCHPGYYNFPTPPPPPPQQQRPSCFITDLSSEEEQEISPRSVLTVRNSCKELPSSPLSPALPRRLRQLPAFEGAKKAPPSSPRCPRLAFDPTADVTSLMIRNIPNSFTKRRFIAILDQHCADENAKLDGDGDGVKSEYDFLYVPIDFGTGSNKGYAFVNMTTAAAARRLHAHLDGHRWQVGSRRKVCDVVHARVEGLDGLVEHFSGSRFPCYGEREFLPVRFDPPRDGVRKTAERVVGRLHHRPR